MYATPNNSRSMFIKFYLASEAERVSLLQAFREGSCVDALQTRVFRLILIFMLYLNISFLEFTVHWPLAQYASRYLQYDTRMLRF